MIREAIARTLARENLDTAEAAAVMHEIMSGHASPAQIAAFLVALRVKGETADEMVGFVRTMREHMMLVRPKTWNHIDTCGTGGDALMLDGVKYSTFNISTTAAFVVAGAGVPVAKHGNRAMSSQCGSADVLEALGVPIEAAPETLAEILDEVGITFLFAMALHPSMRFAAPVRREIGIRTVFNNLGPITNPARANRQLIGVGDEAWLVRTAEALGKLGAEKAIVVHGAPGLDEFSTIGPNRVAEWSDGCLKEYTLDAVDLGVPRADLRDIAGGTLEENAAALEAVLEGERGPRRDIVLLNAAAALLVADRAATWSDALAVAVRSLDSGAALTTLNALRSFRPPGEEEELLDV